MDTVGQRHHESCGLEDMPPELRLHITGFLDQASDVAAALMASRLFAGRSAVDMAVAQGAIYTGRLLEAGAPLDVVRRTVEARGRPLGRGFIESAVRGGRMDVLCFVCGTVCSDTAKDWYDPLQHDRDPDHPQQTDIDSEDCDDDDDDDDDDGSDDGDDDDVNNSEDTDDVNDGLYSNYGPDGRTKEILYGAMRAAADFGHIDALRYLTTRPILACRLGHLVDEDLAIRGARAGHVAIVVYAHDRKAKSYGDSPCSCTRRLGRAAWKAPTADVAMWLRDFGCRGYVEPTVQDMGRAIARGNTTLLRYLINEPTFDVDVGVLGPFITIGAREAHLDTLKLAVDSGLCPRIDPILLGAAQGGSIDVLWWALYDDSLECSSWRQEQGRPSLVLMRTAAIAAAANGRADTVAWIAERHPHVVDLALLCAAINSASLGTVRVVDRLLPAPFDWTRMAARVIETGSVDMVKFIVEEKGVVLDPLAVTDAGDLSDDMIDYLASICASSDIQMAFDVVLADEAFCPTPFTRRLCDRVSGLCTGVAAIGDTEPAGRCACARCAHNLGTRSTLVRENRCDFN
ncbi:hypothetical protein pqer_cds_520 [Pandoravirus quercus]|uniref:Ankyrin repeat domain containing protein n=1 Tax=Pandoravirus quercus TaxID=2107709 RepID=A0A2U7U976_9VIRU|nr:hypothetical protein pqer_cds_520 [Pandoravirus quercus]AVK74942.1 hypothetical protein pqer_cds_520 [Pandoravirus quercus]